MKYKALSHLSLFLPAWLEPPTIRDIRPLSEESDCMVVKWEAGKDSKLMEQACDLRYQMEDSLEWTLVSPSLP